MPFFEHSLIVLKWHGQSTCLRIKHVTTRLGQSFFERRAFYLRICEIRLQLNENGELYIPSSLLRDMGLSPANTVYLAYLSNDGEENEYREFLLSPESIGTMTVEKKLMIPSPLLEQANLLPGEDIQIVCLDGAIVLCRDPALDRGSLEDVLHQLQIATELTASLPQNTSSIVKQLETMIQEGENSYEASE